MVCLLPLLLLLVQFYALVSVLLMLCNAVLVILSYLPVLVLLVTLTVSLVLVLIK